MGTIRVGSGYEALRMADQKIREAARDTVNILAAKTRNEAISGIRGNFMLRNTFTEKSVAFDQARNVRDISQIRSEVGALARADYMARQEEGGTRRPEGGSRLAIPHANARGGSTNRPVRPSNLLTKKKVVRGVGGAGSERSRLIAQAFVAKRDKSLVSYKKTLFSVGRFTRKKSGGISFKLRPLYNVRFASTKTPAKPWLMPAAEKVAARGQEIFNSIVEQKFNG